MFLANAQCLRAFLLTINSFHLLLLYFLSIISLENALKAPDADLALVNLFWEFLQDLKPQVEVIAKASKGSKVKGEDEKGKGKARAWVR